jgi:hypothetical protein
MINKYILSSILLCGWQRDARENGETDLIYTHGCRKEKGNKHWMSENLVLNEEGVLHELSPIPVYTDYIETNFSVEAVIHLHIQEGSLHQVSFLSIIHGAYSLSIAARIPFLHFDKDQISAFFRDDIDFAEFIPMISFKYLVTIALERFDRHFLTALTFLAVEDV